MEIYLVRHGMTEGNRHKRYIGRTDEALSEEGINLIRQKKYPKGDVMFCSPLLRCRQSAELICESWGERMDIQAIPELRECDFGLFENKNYLELSDCPEYQQWIDSNGTLPFPNGEDPADFKKRCSRAFAELVDQLICEENSGKRIYLLVHGGTIMSIMEHFARPCREYYSWNVNNGGGYRIEIKKETWMQEHLLYEYERIGV